MANWRRDEEAVRWLDDGQQDAIPQSAARVLGAERTAVLAQQAEAEGRWWSAAARWAAAAKASRWEMDDKLDNPAIKFYKASAAALLHVRVGPTVCSQADRDRLEYHVIMSILTQWDPSDRATYLHRFEPLIASDAGREDVMGRSNLVMMLEHYPACLGGDWVGAGRTMKKLVNLFVEAAQDANADPDTRSYLLTFAGQGLIWFSHYPLSNDSEYSNLFGVGGRLLMEAMESYDVHEMFSAIVEQFNFEIFGCCPMAVFPLLLHWGDVAASNTIVDSAAANFEVLFADGMMDTQQGAQSFFKFSLLWPVICHLAGRTEAGERKMVQLGCDAAKVFATYERLGKSVALIRPRDETEGGFIGEEICAWSAAMLWVMVTGRADSLDLSSVPDPHAFAAEGFDHGDIKGSLGNAIGLTSVVWPALAFERLGMSDRALAYVNKALERDVAAGGNDNTLTRSLAAGCRGRVLAAAGRATDAARAFEDAVRETQSRDYHFLEASALFDWVQTVPGAAAEQGARLTAAVVRLVSGKEEVEFLLGSRFHGWRPLGPLTESGHASAMRGEPMLAGDPTLRLQRELTALKMSELRKRAMAESIDGEVLEEAEDSDDPRAGIVALLLDTHVPAKSTAESQDAEEKKQLRLELTALKMSELRKRAMAESIDGEVLEEAEDSDDPRAGIVALLLDAHVPTRR
jgi:hypothetical protein